MLIECLIKVCLIKVYINKNGVLQMNLRFFSLVFFVFALVLWRLMPMAPNFSPIAAVALFGGAYFAHRGQAFLVIIAAMLLSDLILGFHNTMIFVYAALAITVLMGENLKGKVNISKTAFLGFLSSVAFFTITNFGVWLAGTLYPRTWSGLLECFAMAVPFFHNTLLSTWLYSAVLFGGFALAERAWPRLKAASINS